jgi:recombination DNA repair RAD52 pathway protein
MDIENLLQMSLVGIFTGFGSAVGNYLAQRSFIKQFEKLSRKEVKKNEN